MKIRAYRAEDAKQLCQIHNGMFGDEALAVFDLHEDLLSYEHLGVGVVAGEVVGYTAVSTVPGLPQVRVLRGFIAPQWQRQGFGSQLLQQLISDLGQEMRRWGTVSKFQLSQRTNGTDTSVYHFLRHHNFAIEHEEHHLILQATNALIPQLPNLSITTLPRTQAISQFLTLYDESFGPHAWYQPYSVREVAALLYQPKDLLFLQHQNEIVGFAWVKMSSAGVGEIEPVGILNRWQGRGYGRFLLQSAIHTLTIRGATSIHIATWGSNKPALHLYRSLGFQLDHTLTYLTYDLGE